MKTTWKAVVLAAAFVLVADGAMSWWRRGGGYQLAAVFLAVFISLGVAADLIAKHRRGPVRNKKG